MPTLKQIEAVHWIVQTGSFLAASRRLNATQSTISKRVREIEEELGGPLLCRTGARVTLTPRGETLEPLFAQMLALQDEVKLRSSSLQEAEGRKSRERILRIGLSEVAGFELTPALGDAVRRMRPDLRIIPQITLPASDLQAQLEAGALDMIIVPSTVVSQGLHTRAVGQREFIWAATAGIDLPATRPLGPEALGALPIASPPETTAGFHALRHSLVDGPLHPAVICNAFSTMFYMARKIDLVVYGPEAMLASEIADGYLQRIETLWPMLPITYVAATRPEDRRSQDLMLVATVAKQLFSLPTIGETYEIAAE
ncbi:LysR family transcriptional regulator [Pseudooceanicola nanhaiensis]|uniref:LysR family transcriptional regulator n=1 Tax=Pseudooceanicola nanhaiensis TaxID=375761 RepID=UPI001CD39CC0|nr:LysR family transcriptional regulator [Pseudooceanicola nanhaiensis]MCA0919976.1 LysR family transcriptional regulator [Pseudooceanicola nanhaiensis]